MNQNQKYAIHLDNLRRKHKLTVIELCDGIVDPRNYRRYQSGDRTLTNTKIKDFCDKLKISMTDFYYSASEQDKYEFSQINELYKLIQNKDYLQFYKNSQNIKSKRIIDVQNKRFFDFCFIKVEYQLKKESPKDLLKRLRKISDYPSCLSREAFDFVDLISLQLIAEIEVEFNETKALDKLIQILNSENMIYISSDTSTVIPSIYANVSIFLTRLKRFNEAYILVVNGINYSLRFSNISALSHLYGVKAQCANELGYPKEKDINAIKSMLCAIVKDNPNEIKMIYNTLTNLLNVNPLNLIKKYELELLKKDDKVL